MALLNRDFVAKDSDGNIKKLSLEEILSDYATLENVQELVEGAAPTALDQARLSLSQPNMEALPLEVPFSTSSVKLSTYAYSAEEPIYETEYQIEDRTFSRSDDAYKFIVNESSAPFGVLTDKRCFLVLSLPGLSSFSNTRVWAQADCREAGAVGGNPIVLDWEPVVLGEGGSYSFAYRDSSMPEGFGIYGKLQLSERQEQVGNVHWYSFRLEFTVCGASAWNAMQEAYRLTLSTRNTAGETESQTVDLSSLKYPQLAAVAVSKSNSPLNASTGATEEFSETSKTVLDFKAHRGISIALEQDDPLDAASDRKLISIGLDFEDIAGDGIVQDADGRLSVPYFKAATEEEAGSFGVVPAPQAEDPEVILTTTGWTSLDDLNVARNLTAFKGATYSEDGWQGLVPTPQVEDKDSFLKGDGTWVKAVSTLNGNFECMWQSAKKEHTFGFGVCDMKGNWIGRTNKAVYYLRPDSVEEYTLEMQNIEADEISGVCLCHPYTSDIPGIPEDRSNGWIADKILWSTDKTKPYIVHFADGTAAKAWLVLQDKESQVQVNSDDPDAEPIYETVTTTYAIMHLQVYGPKAVQPWQFQVKIDGTEQYELMSESTHEEQMVFVASGQGEVCVMPTLHSTTYNYIPEDAEEEEDPDTPPHEGHDPSIGHGQGMGGKKILDIPEAAWVALTNTEQVFADLHMSIAKDASHIRALGDEVSIAGWPQESAGAEISLDYGYGNIVLTMECLTSWMNERLEEVEKNASVSIEDIPVFTGATESESSAAGLVPPANPNDRNKVLTGDGRWSSALVDTFVGATEGAGADGLVPTPADGDAGKYLKGDGTWGVPVQDFDAVEDVSGTMVPAGTDRIVAVDFANSLSLANAYILADPSVKVWISTEGEVSTASGEGDTGVYVQAVPSEGKVLFGQYWNDIPEGGGDPVYTESGEEGSLDDIQDGSGEWIAFYDGGTTIVRLNGTWDDAENALRITALRIWKEVETENFTGLTIVKKNTITGDPSVKTIDLGFVGATQSTSGVSGLVPRPLKEDYGKLLSAQGEWIPVDANSLLCTGYQKADGNSGQPLHIAPSDSIISALGKLEGYLHGTLLSDRYVSLASDQTITGKKTFASNTFAVPVEVENGVVDVSASSVFTLPVEGDTVIQFTGVPEGQSASFSLAVENGGSHNITWPSSIEWVNGEPPSLKETGTDLLQFETWDGGETWHVSGSVPIYKGATASADGITGTVPPASSANRNAYLRGDGTWSHDIVVTSSIPTDSTPGSVFFYIED